MQRAVMLHRLHPQTRITGRYLGLIYKNNWIKRKAINLRKINTKQKQGEINRCIEEAKEALEVEIQLGTQIYYLDECMFTTQTYYRREFAPKRMNVELPTSQFNIQSTALVAAIGMNMGVVHFQLF